MKCLHAGEYEIGALQSPAHSLRHGSPLKGTVKNPGMGINELPHLRVGENFNG
ncbi:hypothetical protein [uncultured Duncaniella sp.]|uniref:hypothetical protein n=1 Tax=uncultured Duncaniella sp. TaxID=2768039 RepID=UPI002631245B|nr:hypothetical protein [uncultured Duncaniella sp.]